MYLYGCATYTRADALYNGVYRAIADALKTVLTSQHERPDLMKTAIELAIKLLEQ